jgi:methionyl-tRNA formyltransferase
MRKKVNKVLLMASKELGLCTLKTIYALSPKSLAGVITYDDSHETRAKFGEFKAFTTANKIPLYVAENNKHAEEIINEVKPELCLLVCWYWLISEKTLQSVPSGFIIMHNSLLPRYRGASPLVWAMINEETKVGFSLFIPGKGTDDGPVLAQGAVPVGPDDYIGDVFIKLEKKIKEVLNKKYLSILNGSIKPKVQNSKLATYCAQRIPDDGSIDWKRSAQFNYNFIRAQSTPYPGAFTYIESKMVKIWSAKLYDGVFYGTPGQVAKIGPEGVYVISGDNQALILQEVELEGRRGNSKEFFKSIKVRFSNQTVAKL